MVRFRTTNCGIDRVQTAVIVPRNDEANEMECEVCAAI